MAFNASNWSQRTPRDTKLLDEFCGFAPNTFASAQSHELKEGGKIIVAVQDLNEQQKAKVQSKAAVTHVLLCPFPRCRMPLTQNKTQFTCENPECRRFVFSEKVLTYFNKGLLKCGRDYDKMKYLLPLHTKCNTVKMTISNSAQAYGSLVFWCSCSGMEGYIPLPFMPHLRAQNSSVQNTLSDAWLGEDYFRVLSQEFGRKYTVPAGVIADSVNKPVSFSSTLDLGF